MQYEIVEPDGKANAIDRAYRDHTTGLEQLGSGLWSSVYGREDLDYVVKVMNGEDRGYRAWVDVATEIGLDSPYMPRVLRAIHYQDDEAGTVVYYLERLRARRACKERHHSSRRYSDMIEHIMMQMIKGRIDINRFRAPHRDLIAGLMLAREVGNRWCFDLHTGNFMMRGRQVVITDPLS